MINRIDKRLKSTISFFLLKNALNSEVKVLEWLKLPNYILGAQIPAEMIIEGREHKLIEYITWNLDDN